MSPLPDEALVVRGGTNSAESFARGTGVALGDQDRLQGVSVNAGAGLTVAELTAPDPATGYPGIPHTQVGVTTAGAVRAAGGDVVPSPSRVNRHHATLSGLTADLAASLFQPTVLNPNRAGRRKGRTP